MNEKTTNRRKMDHIRIVNADRATDREKGYFDAIRLTHRALPELDLDAIDPSINFLGKTLSFPLVLSAMTGGDHTMLRKINRNLARAAEATGVAMSVGSQRVMFSRPVAANSFALRQYAPTAPLLANLGAVQLNKGFGLDECRQAIEVLEADGLYFHLNPLQEAIQPEGDIHFANLAEKIGRIARQLSKPVLLKEVGAGFSTADARLAISQGIRYVDIAGSGGTSWSRVEHFRQMKNNPSDMGLIFQDWGLPTPLALQLLRPFRDRLTLIASGGIRSGVDMVKAMALGASLCGLAQPLLKPAMTSADTVIEFILRLKKEFTTCLFLMGLRQAPELVGNDSVIVHDPVTGKLCTSW